MKACACSHYRYAITAAVILQTETNLALEANGHSVGELEDVRFAVGHVQRLHIGRVAKQKSIRVAAENGAQLRYVVITQS